MALTTPIHEAVKASDKQKMKLLLVGNNSTVNQLDGCMRTPLNLAMRMHLKYPFICLLLDNGADPNIKDDNGRTPLHYVNSDNQLPIVKLLVSSGANPNIKDARGVTPLQSAVSCRCHKILTYLLEQIGILWCLNDINDVDNRGCTLLHYAVMNGDPYVIDLLLTRTDINSCIQDNNGNTPSDYMMQ